MRPPLMPMPARCDTYLTMALVVALTLSRSSSHSISTQELNWRIGVRTPAMMGVGSEILKRDTAS